MNMFKKARLDLKEALENAGITVSEFIPEAITPPLAVISAGNPYAEAATFTDFTVRLDVRLYVDAGTNETVTSALDEALEAAIINLGDWGISNIGQPVMVQSNDAMYLAIDLAVSNTYQIGGN